MKHSPCALSDSQRTSTRATSNPKDYPPVPAFSWLGGLSPLVLVPAAMPALALYFAPTNVLDRVIALRVFTNWLKDLIPHLSAHADATQIPQVALLVDSLVLSSAAFIALVVVCQSTLNYRYLYRRHMATGPHPLRTYLLGIFVASPFFVALLAAMVMIPGDVSWAPGATQSRTFFYGFLSVSMSYLAGLALGATPLTLRLFLDAWLFSRPVTFCHRRAGR